MNEPTSPAPSVRVQREGGVGVIVIDNPPVNASSIAVRAELLDAVRRLCGDASLVAGVIIGAGRGFVAGADIKEFDKPAVEPGLSAVIAAIEDCSKPVVAAIHGVALGGGLELALGCDARLAARDALVGLPEVTLGIIPGAGGTQRLPRLVGIPKAIELIVSGRRIGAPEAAGLGIIDAMVDGRPAGRGRGLCAAHDRQEAGAQPAGAGSEAAEDRRRRRAETRARRAARSRSARRSRSVGRGLPLCRGARRGAGDLPRGWRQREATALRHLFFAERGAQAAGIAGAKPLAVKRVGIVGGGTMGSGIAATFAERGSR